MKPGNIRGLAAGGFALGAMLVPGAAQAAGGGPLSQATLDGLTRADGIRSWIEIAEPGNLGLLLMGIAGVLIGRWAAGKKPKDPPEG